MRAKFLLILAFAFIFLCALTTINYELSYAEIPHLLNYQGKLTDKSGKPLDGSYALNFAIFDASSGGSLLWQEAYPSVAIQKGIFSILLGSSTPLNIPFDNVMLPISQGVFKLEPALC